MWYFWNVMVFSAETPFVSENIHFYASFICRGHFWPFKTLQHSPPIHQDEGCVVQADVCIQTSLWLLTQAVFSQLPHSHPSHPPTHTHTADRNCCFPYTCVVKLCSGLNVNALWDGCTSPASRGWITRSRYVFALLVEGLAHWKHFFETYLCSIKASKVECGILGELLKKKKKNSVSEHKCCFSNCKISISVSLRSEHRRAFWFSSLARGNTFAFHDLQVEGLK